MRFKIDEARFYDAVRQGVRDAVWQVATNASDTPCHDFFISVQKGVEAAMADVTIYTKETEK